MTQVKLTLITGEKVNIKTDNPGEYVTALQQQFPAQLVTDPADKRRRFVNMRNVADLEYSTEPEEEDADPNADPDRNVAQLKEALDAGGIKYDPKALKADLQKLATEHGV